MQGSAKKIPMRVVAATVAGNALEFFDFVTYAFFAVYIGQTFFPATDPFNSLLASVAVFGVGFVFRPLGGILIGAYADRAGRRPAMLLTIALITIGTMGLALTPSYAQIGVAAPVIVIVCRLVQGLALGGEVGPASVFLIEAAPAGRRGLYSSWQLASQGLAVLAAGLLGLGLSLVLTKAELTAWGWRIPFALCLLLVPVAFYLRRTMPETLTEGAPAERARLSAHSKLIVLAVLVILGGTVSTYVSNYMTTYAIATLHLPSTVALSATVIGGVALFGGALVGGWLADRYGRRGTMIWPRLLLALTTWPLFILLSSHPTVANLYLATIVLTGLTAISSAASLVVIPELLPKAVRSTGLSIAYAVGVSLFGGTTQYVVTWLIKATDNPVSPAWYVTLTSVITLAAMWVLPESRDRNLDA
ncbi:MAG: MFS transporter [Proteobacteria bacterium]|nr:MFS transporter [Pseudomonadota bacterium]MBS0547163.1 MFS transporter [Pseudomonadota bacterium]